MPTRTLTRLAAAVVLSAGCTSRDQQRARQDTYCWLLAYHLADSNGARVASLGD